MIDLIIRAIADGLVFLAVLLGGLAFVLSIKKDIYQSYVKGFMAGLTAYTIAKIMSLFYQTLERPFVTLGVEPRASFLDNPGFPSDHALFVMTITLVVWAATGRRDVGLILLGLSLLVGFGRVVALVHTPQDVIGGFAAAYLGVGIWYGFTFWKRKKP